MCPCYQCKGAPECALEREGRCQLFRLQKGDGELTTSRVTVFFKDQRLDHFEGGNLPTENDYIARIAGTPQKATVASPEAAQPPINISK